MNCARFAFIIFSFSCTRIIFIVILGAHTVEFSLISRTESIYMLLLITIIVTVIAHYCRRHNDPASSQFVNCPVHEIKCFFMLLYDWFVRKSYDITRPTNQLTGFWTLSTVSKSKINSVRLFVVVSTNIFHRTRNAPTRNSVWFLQRVVFALYCVHCRPFSTSTYVLRFYFNTNPADILMFATVIILLFILKL